jgi:hypothetical protein
MSLGKSLSLVKLNFTYEWLSKKLNCSIREHYLAYSYSNNDPRDISHTMIATWCPALEKVD